MIPWATDMVAVLGYGGVALLMLIEDIVLPIPSEVIMPVAGFASARYGLSLWGVVLAGTAGSLVGGLPWYYLGTVLGRGRVPAWLARRHGTLHPGKLRTAEQWFARHGGLAVLLARLLPGVRPLVGIPAGMARMPLPTFLLYSTLGTLVWTTGLALAGRLLGANFQQVTRLVGPALWLILGVGLCAAAYWVFKRRRLGHATHH